MSDEQDGFQAGAPMSDSPQVVVQWGIPLGSASEGGLDITRPEANVLDVALPDDAVVRLDHEGIEMHVDGGSLDITFEYVKAVTVADLAWVEEHTITRVFDTVSHFVRFVGGGQLRFAFSFDGDLLELSSDGASLTVSPDGQTLVFGPKSLATRAA